MIRKLAGFPQTVWAYWYRIPHVQESAWRDDVTENAQQHAAGIGRLAHYNVMLGCTVIHGGDRIDFRNDPLGQRIYYLSFQEWR